MCIYKYILLKGGSSDAEHINYDKLAKYCIKKSIKYNTFEYKIDG